MSSVLGTLVTSKMDKFPEILRKGEGGGFPIQRTLLPIFGIINQHRNKWGQREKCIRIMELLAL